MVRVQRSLLPVVPPLAALIASLVRWWMQGSGNLYTAIHKRFYVADPDLGWRVAADHPVWVGLEVCAIIAVIAVGLVAGAFVIRALERRFARRMTALRLASWAVAAATLVVPIAAFASGGAPAGARDVLPAAVAVAIEDGVDAALALPAGRYTVVTHAGTAISARISAGGEAFDARFTDVHGALDLDPRALGGAVAADVSVATASVDTGVGERTDHARDSYLRAGEFPRIAFALDQLVAARQETPTRVVFRARGTVELIGKRHAVVVTGSLGTPDAAARARLGLDGDILLVVASFDLAIHETALAPDAGDFDGDRLPISISLVMRHTRE
jgi:polyisoprenoid-binding protein YceI